jgi:hypothetical protein
VIDDHRALDTVDFAKALEDWFKHRGFLQRRSAVSSFFSKAPIGLVGSM